MLKELTYGASGAGLGKVATAKRYNYFPAFAVDVAVTESYGYGGPSRAVTSRSTQLHYFGANQERFDQTFAWNRDGSPASVGYPRCFSGGCPSFGSPARTVSNSYAHGFLTGVNGYASIGYHKNGLVASVAHVNGVTATTANDPVLIRRPASIQIAGPGWSQWTGGYSYDGAGNIKAIGPDRFAYDGASRLVTAQMGIGGQTNTQQHAFDAFGNVQSITTNGIVRHTPTSTSTNRLEGSGPTAPVYDDAGNLRSWPGAAYEYDRLNMTTRRTVGGEDWLFAYTADDERIWSFRTNLGGSILTLRDLGGKVLRRFDSHLGWGTFTDSIYRGGDLVATVDQANTVTHFHVDHLGTPRILTNASGQAIRYYTYYPFGEELFPANDTQPFRFTGHERDLLSTLSVADDHDYMRARDTRPILGRFLSPDKAASWNPGQPQSWNRYAYVTGNPLKYLDPDGNWALLALATIEIGLTIFDLNETSKVIADPASDGWRKYSAVGLLAVGLATPGGGYTKLTDDVADAGRLLAQNYLRGKEFESAARKALDVAENTTVFRPAGARGTRPDSMTRAVWEFKDRVEVSNSLQLKLQAIVAKMRGLPLNLVVSSRTKRISESLRTAIRDSGGTIYEFDPEADTLRALTNHLP